MPLYVRKLEGFTPPATDDSVVFTIARLQEAPDTGGQPGTFEDRGDQAISDYDSADPPAMDFTVTTATSARSGWWRIIWVTADDQEHIGDPVRLIPWLPTLRDVARLIPARTVADGGQTGTFTATTQPSADEVLDYIDSAVTDVETRVGYDLSERVFDKARRVATLGAVLYVELGAEDYDRDRYKDFKDRYKEALADLDEAAQEAAQGGDPGDVDDHASPLGSFPDPQVTWLDAAPTGAPGSEDPRRWP